MSVKLYETRNSTYAVDGMWIRAAKGGNDLLGPTWRRAAHIEDTGRVLVVRLLGDVGFTTSAITRRVGA